jgi:YggT family protein
VNQAIAIVATVLYFLLLAFFSVMLVRFVFEWVRALRRGWRPTGFLLLVAEAAYTVTDPPIKAMRKVVPPIRAGAVQLDLAGSLVLLVCIVLMWVVGAFRSFA